MKIKLLEKKWRHKIPQQLADNFKNALGEYADATADGSDIRLFMYRSYEPIKKAATEVLEFCKSFYDAEEDDYVIDEIDDLINSVDSITDDEYDDDSVDDVINELYDFMDGYSILLGDGAKMVTLNPEGDELDEARLVYDDEKDYSEDILKVSSLLADWVGSLSQPEFKKLIQYSYSTERVEVALVKKSISDFVSNLTSGSIVVSNKVTHAGGIGNNNAFEIHKVTPVEKEHIGFLSIVDNMYGSCFVYVQDTKRKLVGDTYKLSSTFILKNNKEFKNFKESDRGI